MIVVAGAAVFRHGKFVAQFAATYRIKGTSGRPSLIVVVVVVVVVVVFEIEIVFDVLVVLAVLAMRAICGFLFVSPHVVC